MSCQECSKHWTDKHSIRCDRCDIPSVSVMFEMICAMKEEIATLNKTLAKFTRNCDKLLPCDIYFEDWAKRITVSRDNIYGIIAAGSVQGIINVMWHNIDCDGPLCLYNNTVLVYSKNGWRPITKSLLSIATQNIQSQIPTIFNNDCPELTNVDDINFNYDTYIKNIDILITQSLKIETFMKCILKSK